MSQLALRPAKFQHSKGVKIRRLIVAVDLPVCAPSICKISMPTSAFTGGCSTTRLPFPLPTPALENCSMDPWVPPD